MTQELKAREDKPPSADEGSCALGTASLIAQVQTMIEESGNPDGFDAERLLDDKQADAF